MVKRNVNIKLYPTKWEEFTSKYDYERATEEYWKFCRAFCLEKYILKYGEEIGKKKYEEKKANRTWGVTLENCISKHGKEKGKEVYENWKKGVSQTLDNLHYFMISTIY